MNLLFNCSQLEDFDLYESILHLTNENKLKGLFSDSDQPSGLQLSSYQSEWLKYNNQFVFICRLLFEIIKHFPPEKEEDSLFSMNTKNFSDFYVKICHLCSNSHVKSNAFTELPQYLRLKNLVQIASNVTINEIVCAFSHLISKQTVNEGQEKFSDEFLDELVDLNETLEKLKQNFTEIQANELGLDEAVENILEAVDPYQISNESLALKSKSILNRRSSLKPNNKKILGESNSDLVRANSLFLTAKPTLNKGLIQKKKLNNNISANYRSTLIEWLEGQFQIYFNKDFVNKDAYAKYFCYTNLNKVQKRLFDVSRINIHNCLFNADEALKATKSGCENSESPKKRTRNSLVLQNPIEISHELMFPLSVVYKIYLECGHMINLFDWLQVSLF